MASLNVGNLGNLGEFLREQRRSAQLSLRQLADAAGVSNPYLSQIERGLRKPSAEILQQLAKALRISAETLYVQAGILDEREQDGMEVRAAVLADPLINERQKQVLLQIYDSFRKENAAAHPAAESAAGRGEGERAQVGPHRDGPEPDGSGPGVRARGGAAARTAAKKAAAKVADAVAEVAETVGSRSRALKAAAPHDDDKDGTKRNTGTSRPFGSAATREATGPQATGPVAAAGAAEPGAGPGA